MKLKMETDTKSFLRDLSRMQGGLHQASSRTINNLGEITIDRYNRLIKSDFKIRTKFTLNALKMYKSTYMRKSKPGALRPLRDINAILYIKNLNGDIHYLVIQEEGLSKQQHKSADGTVSVPTESGSRAGGDIKGKVAPKFTLKKSGINTLRAGGTRVSAHDFGLKGGRFTEQQAWAILQKYKKQNPYGWDLKKPFRFTWEGNTDAYALKGKEIMMVRVMREKSMKVKKRPNYEIAFSKLKESEAQQIFNTVASRILR